MLPARGFPVGDGGEAVRVTFLRLIYRLVRQTLEAAWASGPATSG